MISLVLITVFQQMMYTSHDRSFCFCDCALALFGSQSSVQRPRNSYILTAKRLRETAGSLAVEHKRKTLTNLIIKTLKV